MSEHSAAVQAAKETEARLTALEHDVPHLSETIGHRLEDLKAQLDRIEKQTTDTNGTVGRVVADLARTDLELGKHASRIVDLQSDIDDSDGRIEVLEEARHLDVAAKENADQRRKGRWDVLKAQWKVIAAIYALGGGTAGVVAVVAYLLEWRPL